VSAVEDGLRRRYLTTIRLRLRLRRTVPSPFRGGLSSRPAVRYGLRQHTKIEGAMAVEVDANTDIQSHVKSYDRFSAMMKWGTIVSFIVAALVVIIISS
jgi:hypothetical protein